MDFGLLFLVPGRIGKTTLMRTVINELNGIYIAASKISGLKGLGLRLIDEVRRLNIKVKLNLAVPHIEIERKPTSTIESLIKELGDVVIGIDEVQNIVNPRLPALLSVAYNESRVKFIFSGSLVGTVRLLMRSPEALGRPLIKFELKPFTREQAIDFLKTGSRSCGLNITDTEIGDAVNEFNGIVGWLTYYGSLRVSGINYSETVETLTGIARELIKNELSKLNKYGLTTYRALAILGRARWIEIKRLTETLIGHPIDDKTFTVNLRALVNMYMVKELERGVYEPVTDTMVKIIRDYGI